MKEVIKPPTAISISGLAKSFNISILYYEK